MLRTVLRQIDITLFQDYLGQHLERPPFLSLEFCRYFKNEWHIVTEQAWVLTPTWWYISKENTKELIISWSICWNWYTRDKLFERVIKLTGKTTIKLKNIQDRHKKRTALTIDHVKLVDDSDWQVKSEDGNNTYTVSKQQDTYTDSTCELKCTECCIQIYIHQYVCPCPDCLIQHITCKHIHLLQRFLSVDNKLAENNAEMEDINGSQDFVNNELKLLSSHIHAQNKAPNDIASPKQSIRGKLFKLAEQIESCTNKEALQQLDKHINSAKSMFSSLQIHVCHQKMQPITNTPANKKIENQKGFRSTKK